MPIAIKSAFSEVRNYPSRDSTLLNTSQAVTNLASKTLFSNSLSAKQAKKVSFNSQVTNILIIEDKRIEKDEHELSLPSKAVIIQSILKRTLNSISILDKRPFRVKKESSFIFKTVLNQADRIQGGLHDIYFRRLLNKVDWQFNSLDLTSRYLKASVTLDQLLNQALKNSEGVYLPQSIDPSYLQIYNSLENLLLDLSDEFKIDRKTSRLISSYIPHLILNYFSCIEKHQLPLSKDTLLLLELSLKGTLTVLRSKKEEIDLGTFLSLIKVKGPSAATSIKAHYYMVKTALQTYPHDVDQSLEFLENLKDAFFKKYPDIKGKIFLPHPEFKDQHTIPIDIANAEEFNELVLHVQSASWFQFETKQITATYFRDEELPLVFEMIEVLVDLPLFKNFILAWKGV